MTISTFYAHLPMGIMQELFHKCPQQSKSFVHPWQHHSHTQALSQDSPAYSHHPGPRPEFFMTPFSRHWALEPKKFHDVMVTFPDPED